MMFKFFVKRILSNRMILRAFGWVYHEWNSFQYDEYRNMYNIHEEFNFNGDGIKLYGGGEIIAGRGSYIGRLSRIASVEGTSVTIGKNCAISHHVLIYTGNRVADQDMSQPSPKISRGDVVIGDNVWIGANVFITEGIEIGKNSVIGANSVVTHDIPPNAIAAGVPAEVKKYKSSLSGGQENN